MALGLERVRQFVSVKDGKIIKKDDGITEEYDYIEGRINSIYKTIREFRGIPVEFLQIQIDDYVLSLKYEGGITLSLLNCLCSVDGYLQSVKIRPYQKDGYSKAVIFHDKLKLSWKYKEIPKDEIQRKIFIDKLFNEVSAKIPLPEEEPF